MIVKDFKCCNHHGADPHQPERMHSNCCVENVDRSLATDAPDDLPVPTKTQQHQRRNRECTTERGKKIAVLGAVTSFDRAHQESLSEEACRPPGDNAGGESQWKRPASQLESNIGNDAANQGEVSLQSVDDACAAKND